MTKVEIELIYHTVGIKINLSTYVKYRAIFHKKKSKIVCLVSRYFLKNKLATFKIFFSLRFKIYF